MCYKLRDAWPDSLVSQENDTQDRSVREAAESWAGHRWQADEVCEVMAHLRNGPRRMRCN
jgi:hypothetical protein